MATGQAPCVSDFCVFLLRKCTVVKAEQSVSLIQVLTVKYVAMPRIVLYVENVAKDFCAHEIVSKI